MYLHIPKTGGSSVAQSLLQHSTGGRGWWQASVTGNSTWSSIVAKLRQRTRPKQIIIHHVDSPTALSSVAQLIKPLDCWLRSQHCRLVLTTTLRDAATRATSAAYYNRVPHESYSAWVGEHARDGMLSFILHNRVRASHVPNSTTVMSRPDLVHAESLLSEFDAVGRTEDMAAFLAYLQSLLVGGITNATPAAAAGAFGSRRVNDTPEKQKYELTADERAWTYELTALDAHLYSSFCSEAQQPGACTDAARMRSSARRPSASVLGETAGTDPPRFRCEAS